MPKRKYWSPEYYCKILCKHPAIFPMRPRDRVIRMKHQAFFCKQFHSAKRHFQPKPKKIRNAVGQNIIARKIKRFEKT